ncbi:unnamed protein product [Fraxinus pennsylvanica]|uniref:Thioredoxin-related transmembrane protein 2 n=1 Tax=Fraxinus pennsylvanica TaxID=56036 RepID=A0AAD1YRJ2_9LAMI|nr:unnamed protein product [Fraxinus pennsylvanica]
MSQSSNNWNPMKSINCVISEPYYLLHFLAFFSYIPVRCSASNVFSPLRSSHLLYREIQAVLAFCVLSAVKVVKVETWEAFISDTLFFAKIFLVAIALVMDYHVALWYALVFSVIYFIAQQPAYEGLGTANQLTPLQLETLLTEGNKSKIWLVEFRSLSTSGCINSSSIFPELSITYSNKYLSFGIVDLGLFPNAAEKFGITLASLHQLPVYIMFYDGAELTRLPDVDFETKVFNSPISKKLLCRHFELDKLLLDYVKAK